MTYEIALRFWAPLSSFARSLARGTLLARLSAWYAARRGRAAVHRLAAFDDRMLADIGLHRSDVEAAVDAPWDADPTVLLAVRRRRRRDAELAGTPARRSGGTAASTRSSRAL